jgi:hypothetical protein
VDCYQRNQRRVGWLRLTAKPISHTTNRTTAAIQRRWTRKLRIENNTMTASTPTMIFRATGFPLSAAVFAAADPPTPSVRRAPLDDRDNCDKQGLLDELPNASGMVIAHHAGVRGTGFT